MDLIHLYHPTKLESLFIETTVKGKQLDCQLGFEVEHSRFDDESQENIVIQQYVVAPNVFSSWWQDRLTEGYTVAAQG